MGRELGQSEHYSEKLMEQIDSEVQDFVQQGYDRALTLLRENKEVLEKMSEALMIREVLSNSDLETIMAGKELITDEERKRYEANKKKKLEAKAASEDKKPGDGKAPGGLNPMPQGT